MEVSKKLLFSFAALPCCFWAVAGFAPYRGSLVQQVREPAEFFRRQPFHLTSLEQLAPKDFEEWILKQRELSFEFLLDNVAPNGTNANEALPGTDIASPSRESPDYYYQWIRDAAITMGNVVDEYHRTQDGGLKALIDMYGDVQSVLQNTFNPSGGYTTGGLGEPKFLVDGAPFTQLVSSIIHVVERNWSRPQHDGAALRALTLIKYTRVLNDTNPELLDRDGWIDRMYDRKTPTRSVIKADLEYIASIWNTTGFDLWEEVKGIHFFTALVQHRALAEGTELALSLNDTTGAQWYVIQQDKLREFLIEHFWNAEKGHLMSMLNIPQRGGLDSSLMLGALLGGQELFPPFSNMVLASVDKLVQDMAVRHAINHRTPPFKHMGRLYGSGIGRYPEDVYDGVGFQQGNPWFLCTSSVSSILYSSIIRFLQQGFFDVDDINQSFFDKFSSKRAATKGHYNTAMPEFEDYLVAMLQYADSFLQVIRWHATDEGRLSEQFDSVTGFQRGARDLTWSCGSFIGAADQRMEAKRWLFGKISV